jgi:hypothetical protein
MSPPQLSGPSESPSPSRQPTRSSVGRPPAGRESFWRLFPGTHPKSQDLAELWRVRLIQAAREGLLELHRLIDDRRCNAFTPADIRTFADHPGAKGIAEDAHLNGLFRTIFSADPNIVYHGEEQPIGLFAWKPGLVIVESDPVDGSGPLCHQAGGAAIVLTAWLCRSDGRLQHLAGVVLRVDGTMVSWNATQSRVVVRVPSLSLRGPTESRYELRRGDVVAGDPTVVACVGAAGEQLAKVARLDVDWCSSHGVTVYNSAGTPATVSLLLDHTSAIFETDHQKVWDAAGLIPLVLSGGAVYELDGRPYDVLAHMERLTDLSSSARRIRPYIAVSHPDAVDTILGLISS